MGMGGAGQLTLEAKKALESCQLLFGAPRMLRDVASLAPEAEKVPLYLAEDIRKQVPEGVVYSYTDRMIRFYCTNYYMNNQMRNFTLENPQEGYVILSANAQEEFLKNYNAKYQLEEVFHTDYRSCDLRNTVIMYKFNEKRK